MQITTRSLDKAAFFIVFGGKLLEIIDKWPDNSFKVEMPRWVAWYQRIGGWVPHNHFCNVRRELKRKSRKQAGLPEHFTGDKKPGYMLMDVATWKPWKKKELDRLNNKG